MNRKQTLGMLCLLSLTSLSLTGSPFAQPLQSIFDENDATVDVPPMPSQESPADAPLDMETLPSIEELPPQITTTQPPAADNTPATTPPPATEQASLPEALEVINETSDPNFKASYGDWPFSLMFPTQEIGNLKNILALYERKGFIKEEEEEAAEPEVDEIIQALEDYEPVVITFPSFRLRSIMYRGPNDWTVWLNNDRITNKSNEEGEEEIVVSTINEEVVEFTWVPRNAELLSAILQKQLVPEKAPTTTAIPTNLLASDKSMARMDPDTALIHFRLRPNQTFYAGTFEILEGAPTILNASFQSAEENKNLTVEQMSPSSVNPDDIIDELERDISGQPASKKQKTSGDNVERKNAISGQSPKARLMRTLGLK